MNPLEIAKRRWLVAIFLTGSALGYLLGHSIGDADGYSRGYQAAAYTPAPPIQHSSCYEEQRLKRIIENAVIEGNAMSR